jgi:hypothetical protein
MGFNAAGATVASAGFGRNLPRRLELPHRPTALAMLTLKCFTAASRDNPPDKTDSTTRVRRSSESAIPAASVTRREA